MTHKKKKKTLPTLQLICSPNAMKNKPAKFARATCTKRTLEWVIHVYSMKGYLNPRWRAVTIDLRSKSCMCCILEMGLTTNFAADLSLQIFNNHSSQVRCDQKFQSPITNFQDLVAKVENLVALAPVLGAILGPVSSRVQESATRRRPITEREKKS